MATPFVEDLRAAIARDRARRERESRPAAPPPPKGATTPTRAATRKAGKAARKRGKKARRAVVQRARPPVQTSPGVSPETRTRAARYHTPEGRRNRARAEREERRRQQASPGVDAETRRNAARAQTPEARRRREAASGRRVQPVSQEQREFLADVAAVRRAERMGPEATISGAGLVGFPAWLENLQEQANAPSPFLGGFLENLGRGAVDIATGVPSMLQLGGEALAYGPIAAADAALPDNNLVGGMVKNAREGIEDDLRRAGSGIRDDYAYRWGPLLEGDLGTFGSRFYENPLPTILDTTGVGSALGKSPAAAARATARIAPEGSAVAERARNFNSILGPGERIPGTNRVTTRPGARHRPPKRVTGTAQGVTKRGDERVESRTIEVPQRPYSSNVATRAVQKGATRLNRRVIAPRVERAAARRQVPEGQRVPLRTELAGRVARPLTEQAKFNRQMRRTVRERKLVREQAAEAKFGEIARPFNRAVRRLRPDRNAAGVRAKGPSAEALATRMHLEGVLAPRAGVSPVALRDRAVETMRAGLERRRAAGERVDMEAAQLAALERIPEELLTLRGDAPAVKRVRAAVSEGRRLDARAQAMEVASKVVTRETARERGSLSSRVLLAGQEDAGRVMAAMRRAGASRKDVAAVRASAIRETPRVVELRGQVAAAKSEHKRLKGKKDRSQALARVKAARATVREAEAAQRGRVADARAVAQRERAAAGERHQARVSSARRDVAAKKAEVAKQRRIAKHAREEAAAQAVTKAANREKAAAAEKTKAPTMAQAFSAGRKTGTAEERFRAATRPIRKAKSERARVAGRNVAELEDRHRLLESAVHAVERRSKKTLTRMARDMRGSRQASARDTRTRNLYATGRYEQRTFMAGRRAAEERSGFARPVADEGMRTRTTRGMRDKSLAQHLEELVEEMRKRPDLLTPEEKNLIRDYDLLANIRQQLQMDREAIGRVTGESDPFGGMFTKADIAEARKRIDAALTRTDQVVDILARAGLIDELFGAGRHAAAGRAAARRVQAGRASYADLAQAKRASDAARRAHEAAARARARIAAKPLSDTEVARLNAGVVRAQAELDDAIRTLDVTAASRKPDVRVVSADRAVEAARRERPDAELRELQAAREALADVRGRLVGSAPKIEAAAAKKRDLAKQLKRAEDEALGFTPPTRPELVGHEGVYIPHVRLRKTDPARPHGKGGGRLSGPAVPKRSTGTLIQDGVVDLNPALLSHQAKRAAQHSVGPMSREALDELIGLAAFTDDAGKPIAGGRALRLAQTDPEQVALVRVGALQDALRKLDDAPVGETITRADIDAAVISGKDLIARIDDARKGDYIAISKAAADEWRAMPFSDKAAVRVLDWGLDNWKGAILAFSPRWYVNSGFGVALQYGLLAGGDIRSIIQGNSKSRGIRAAIPDREAINTLAQDVGFKGSLDANRLQRAMRKGFEVNNRMETLWRRAAFTNRAKKHLRREGYRTAKFSDAELAHALTHMPPSIARQITREVDLYMGEFRKFNQFERAVMRRVVPFYSWLRVITRITFGLPFRSPIRAAALSVATKAGMLGINPEDYMRPIYDRGALRLPGGLRLRTSGWNNLYTLVPFAEALGAMKNPTDLRPVVKEFGSWLRPELQLIISQATGTNTFGDDVFAPKGPKKFVNSVTGNTELSKDGVPFMEAFLQAALPAQAGALRRVLTGTATAYDTTSTVDLLMYRLGFRDDRGLFYDRKGKGGVHEKVGPGGTGSTIPGAVGFPVNREDRRALERRFKEGQREAMREAKKDAARKRRESR